MTDFPERGGDPAAPLPVHIRARPGDYAEACLLPGDPRRARYVAERFLEGVRETNSERGLLGYSGSFEGASISVQTTGMGGPSAAIVVEELVGLGVKRFLRIGKCGGLQSDLKLGDVIVALSAVPAEGTARHYAAGEPHAPTASWELIRAAVEAARRLGVPVRVGPVASSDTFTTFDPDPGRERRWAARGVLAVEMEAAVIFTIAALRGVQAGCLLTVADVMDGNVFVRISEPESRVAVDRLIELGLRTLA